MQPIIKPAETDSERLGIYRLRYDVYVDELRRYRGVADHENRHFSEPDDDNARLYCALDAAGEVIGTMRHFWGGDGPFSDRVVEQYDLELFLDDIALNEIIVGERFMVSRAHRGTDLIYRLFCTYLAFANDKRIQLIFGDCEPHLLNLYLGLGFRTYSGKNISSPETGYLIPLIMIPEDVDHFRAIRSPLADVVKDFGSDSRVPACVSRLLEAGSAVASEKFTPHARYWEDIETALKLVQGDRPLLFDGLNEEQIELCLTKSNLIECRTGDHLIKKGNTANNMYICLSGTLEVRADEGVVAVISPGDVFGEMAFLLDSPRTMDVFAVSDNVSVLSLSESIVRKIIESDPETAATLMLNIAKMLCLKLVNSS